MPHGFRRAVASGVQESRAEINTATPCHVAAKRLARKPVTRAAEWQ